MRVKWYEFPLLERPLEPPGMWDKWAAYEEEYKEEREDEQNALEESCV